MSSLASLIGACWLVVVGACSGRRQPAHVDNLASVDKCSFPSEGLPFLILYEHDSLALHPGMTFPTIALWRSGAVLFLTESTKGVTEIIRADVGADATDRLAKALDVEVHQLPPFLKASEFTDQPTVEIVHRDRGGRWSVRKAYGMRRVLAAPVRSVPCPAGSVRRTCGLIENPAGVSAQILQFHAVYEELLRVRPLVGEQFEPAGLLVVTTLAEHGAEPVSWPSEVPVGSPSRVSGRLATPSYAFNVPTQYWAALQRVVSPRNPILLGGQKWWMSIYRRFDGQDSIDSIRGCLGPSNSRVDRS